MLWWLSVPVLIIFWVLVVERNWFKVKSAELKVLPKGSKDIVVLQISDLHLAPWQRRKIRWLQELNYKVQPDLVVNTGDNLGHPKAIAGVLAGLNGLAKVPGVYVNGSNDLYAPAVRNPIRYLFTSTKSHSPRTQQKLDVDQLTSGFDAFGWHGLNNRAVSLEVNGTRLNLFGTDDFHENRADFQKLTNSAKQLNKAEVNIGVTHAPYIEVLKELDSLGSDVIFAGHTHGGQVCVPFTGTALVTNCDLPRRYARGLHRTKAELVGVTTWLQVCAGLGTSIYAPVRLGCRPEVRVLTLKAKV